MRDFWTDLGSYCVAVLHEWQSLLTGGLIMALVGSWEHWQQRSVPPGGYAVMAAALLFIASFLAWRKEHNPAAKLVIETDGMFETADNIQINSYIVNRSRLSRVALKFQLMLEFEDRSTLLLKNPEQVGLDTALGPQEATRGQLVFSVHDPQRTDLLPVHGVCLLVTDAVSGAMRRYNVSKGRGRASLPPPPIVSGWYREDHSLCRSTRRRPENDRSQLLESSTFRIGLVNRSDSRIDGVRVTVGDNSSGVLIFGRELASFPEGETSFSIAGRRDGEPSVFVTVVLAELIERDNDRGILSRYTVGPWERSGRDGVIVDDEPKLELTLRVECPTETVDLPCVIWQQDGLIHFGLGPSG
jgi:hypothetical protein